jgi:hypothetical protein
MVLTILIVISLSGSLNSSLDLFGGMQSYNFIIGSRDSQMCNTTRVTMIGMSSRNITGIQNTVIGPSFMTYNPFCGFSDGGSPYNCWELGGYCNYGGGKYVKIWINGCQRKLCVM